MRNGDMLRAIADYGYIIILVQFDWIDATIYHWYAYKFIAKP
jgi:hypothetical protein